MLKKQNYDESNGELNVFLFRSICAMGLISGTNKIWFNAMNHQRLSRKKYTKFINKLKKHYICIIPYFL